MTSQLDSIVAVGPADIELVHLVQASLAAHRRPALMRLSVEARDGAVTLRGEVSSYYEKQLGYSTVRRIADVRTLVDAVDVIAWPRRGVGN